MRLVAKAIIAMTIASNAPSSANKEIKIGEEVLMFRKKQADKWMGEFSVTN